MSAFPSIPTHSHDAPLVGIVMGSKSDYDTLKSAEDILVEFGVPYEIQVVSAHRTPDLMFRYGREARARGLKVIVAGAGGAAHLPGMLSALTPLPVMGVPVRSRALSGLDSLLSIVQMPAGIPTPTFAVGEAGATNAALAAVAILALSDPRLAAALDQWRAARSDAALAGNAEVQARWKADAEASAAPSADNSEAFAVGTAGA
jgi:5-(carboxyamino)imidazole ribonucleotide mutase